MGLSAKFPRGGSLGPERGHRAALIFVAGLLTGAAVGLLASHRHSTPAIVATRECPTIAKCAAATQLGTTARLERCGAELAVEQSKAVILASNAAAAEAELTEAREEAGCATKCDQMYEHSRAQMQPEPMANPPFVRGAVPTEARDRGGGLTVVTHVSFDRLTSLEQLCRLYPGKIAASVYIDAANITDLQRWCRLDKGCRCGDEARTRLTLRYLLHDGLSRSVGQLYPVNSLRNQALAASATEYTLGIDADFVVGGPADIPRPRPGQLLILPCFKVTGPSGEVGDRGGRWPLSKAKLLRWKAAGRVEAYDDPGWPLGHADVGYGQWANATEPYRLKLANIYFEPYFVGRTNELPWYDERYRGYGAGDKALHFHLMYKLGFEVTVLPDHFLLHLPHADNNWRGDAAGSAEKNLRQHFTQFHFVERMTAGVHQIDFWTRVVNNCRETGCRRTHCSHLAPELSGGTSKCRTLPDRYLTLPWNEAREEG
mmetsp:Transcript_28201/g.73938  ORF Transcript_28201/g.73938 Transcript_28201/m.73938 type:complete len:486 (+) Transcript_28201:99-1556(+)